MSENVFPAGIGTEDALVVAVALAGFVLVVPAQVAWMILFDATGLDALLPTVAFMALVPAIVVVLVPLTVAARAYSREHALGAAGGLFVAYAAFCVYLLRFYAL